MKKEKKNCQKDFPLEIIIIIILFAAAPANLLKSHGRKRAAAEKETKVKLKKMNIILNKKHSISNKT